MIFNNNFTLNKANIGGGIRFNFQASHFYLKEFSFLDK